MFRLVSDLHRTRNSSPNPVSRKPNKVPENFLWVTEDPWESPGPRQCPLPMPSQYLKFRHSQSLHMLLCLLKRHPVRQKCPLSQDILGTRRQLASQSHCTTQSQPRRILQRWQEHMAAMWSVKRRAIHWIKQEVASSATSSSPPVRDPRVTRRSSSSPQETAIRHPVPMRRRARKQPHVHHLLLLSRRRRRGCKTGILRRGRPQHACSALLQTNNKAGTWSLLGSTTPAAPLRVNYHRPPWFLVDAAALRAAAKSRQV